MNDYSFGNYMYEKRKETGESQNELGCKLGVTGKAVSKWENGAAKPKTEIRFPKMLKVIREVTEDEAYKNASLAKLR